MSSGGASAGSRYNHISITRHIDTKDDSLGPDPIELIKSRSLDASENKSHFI